MTQKQRSLALLGGVLVVALAAGAYAWFGVYKVDKAKDQAKDQSDTLFTFKKEQVKKLAVMSHGQTVEAVKSETGWEIQNPLKTAGDTFALDTIADRLAGLKQKRDIGVQSDLAEYGLDHPRVSAVVTLDDGQTAELDLGKDNAYDGTVYAKRGGDGRISILESTAKFPLDKGLFELREKKLFAFEDAQLKHLDVAIPGFAYGLDRSAAGKWQLTAPASMEADSQKAGQILTALKNLRATRFAADQATQADLTRFGLDKAPYTVQLQFDGPDKGQPLEKTLTLAAEKEGTTEHVYAKLADESAIAEVPPAILKDLTATLADLRDKTLFNFDQAAVRGFKFQVGSQSFEALKEGGEDAGPERWTLAQGASGAGKKWKLSALVSSLHDLKGSSIVTEQADPKALAAAGLEAPAKVITVLGEGEAVLGKLLVGKTEGSKVDVRVEGSPRIYQVEGYKLSDVPASPADVAEAPPPDAGATAADAG